MKKDKKKNPKIKKKMLKKIFKKIAFFFYSNNFKKSTPKNIKKKITKSKNLEKSQNLLFSS